MSLAIGTAVPVAAMVVGWLMSRTIARPIVTMTGTMQRLAEGDLEVSVAGMDRHDELGATAAASQALSTAQTVAAAAEAAQDVTQRMTLLSDEATENGGNAEAVESTASRLTGDVRELQQSLTRIVRTSTEDADRCDHRRFPCCLEAVLRGPAGRIAATAIDVSVSGLRLTGHFSGIGEGEAVTVEVAQAGWVKQAVVRGVTPDALHLAFADGLLAEDEIRRAAGLPAAA